MMLHFFCNLGADAMGHATLANQLQTHLFCTLLISTGEAAGGGQRGVAINCTALQFERMSNYGHWQTFIKSLPQATLHAPRALLLCCV